MNRFVTSLAFASLICGRALAQTLTVGPLAGLELSKVPAEYRHALLLSGEDCAEVEAFRIPKYAVPFPLVQLDGGSRRFHGQGYVIVVRQSLLPLAGDSQKWSGYSYGYELYLGSPDFEKYPGIRPIASRVWFVPFDKMKAIEKANHASLEARMPKDSEWLHPDPVDDEKQRPNQSPEPTAMSVTPPAAQEPRQP